MRSPYWFALALLWACVSAAEAPTELQVKAAYVLNFAEFSEWPARAFKDPQVPLVLCVVGGSDTVTAFESIEGKSVHGHEIRIRANPRGAEIHACHVLFLSQSESAESASTLKATAGRPILAVSDIRGFADGGGMLGLVQIDGRIRFEANVQSAKTAGLRLGAQLLGLAQSVK